MKYRQYNNNSNYIWLGLIAFIFLGGSKFIFMIFGLLIGIVGIILALLIQLLPLIMIGGAFYWLSKSIRKNSSIGSYVTTHSPEHQRFVTLLIHLSMHIIHADGKVDRREIQTLQQFFKQALNFNPTQLQWTDDLIRDAQRTSYSINDLCQEFYSTFKSDGKRLLIHLLYQIAHADGQLAQSEEDLILSIVKAIQVSSADHEQIRALFGLSKQSESDAHFAVLGLSKGASKEEIKKAYRRESKKHHPDRVHHLGESFRKVAEENMQKINKAYAALHG